MLKLINIKKDYMIAGKPFRALDDINLSFEKSSFVAILGPSGCGKTTLLNLIGGLDQYTEGDLIIEGKSTKHFKDHDWDYYRNNKVGFIFQNYHLINHISIIENVELGMTLSGIDAKQRREKAKEVLRRVGLADQMYKKSGQLSGGQKQRAAIARALANDPEIILADEPTGALDTKTSVQILELIKEIAQDKLVIMVTHNKDLADKYATRVINLLDGKLVSDTNQVKDRDIEDNYHPRKTSMNYLQAFKLSFRNLRTKLGRTLTTSFAGSIGIIGVLLVLGLGNGFNKKIKSLERESLASVPILINEVHLNLDINQFQRIPEDKGGFQSYDPNNRRNSHRNIITKEFIDYIESEENLDSSTLRAVEYLYSNQNIFLKRDDQSNVTTVANDIFSQLEPEFLEEYYQIVAGQFYSDNTTGNTFEVVILMNQYYQINKHVLEAFGFDPSQIIPYDNIVGKELKLAHFNDYYFEDTTNIDRPVYRVNANLNEAYDKGITLKVVGVLMPKEDTMFNIGDGIFYTQALTERAIDMAQTSNIVAAQRIHDYLVFDLNVGDNRIPAGTPFTAQLSKEMALKYLGDSKIPTSLAFYPNSYEDKVKIKASLDAYNKDKKEEDQILYTDIAESFGNAMEQIVSMVQIVLVVFASISLVVSSIMIGIITYVSVLERTQEIGVLRALGARKKDIKRVFNSETFLIGLTSGVMGSAISLLLAIPLNIFIAKLEPEMANVITITIIHISVLIVISVILTFIAGLIPASMAARKHPVDALRHNE